MVHTSKRGEKRREIALILKTTPQINECHPLGNRLVRRHMAALNRKSPRTVISTKGAFGSIKI